MKVIFIMLPATLAIFNLAFKIITEYARGIPCKRQDRAVNEKGEEPIKEKINIDKDLQKYFNYKE